jgi:hypothetical protein
MVESSWPVSEVMQEHLQNLMSQGYMTAMELATCRVPEDYASPAPVGGWYVMSFMAFYEQGLVCHHINFSTPYCGPMAWSCIT